MVQLLGEKGFNNIAFARDLTSRIEFVTALFPAPNNSQPSHHVTPCCVTSVVGTARVKSLNDLYFPRLFTDTLKSCVRDCLKTHKL